NAWFIGYTPRLATGVWVGYDRPKSLGRDETGSRVAVPIWTAFMSEALAGTGAVDFPVPDRVVVVPVDLNASGGCVRPVMMAFVAGTEPKITCGPAKYAPVQVPTPTAPPTPARTEPVDQAQAQTPSHAPPSIPPPIVQGATPTRPVLTSPPASPAT